MVQWNGSGVVHPIKSHIIVVIEGKNIFAMIRILILYCRSQQKAEVAFSREDRGIDAYIATVA